MIGAYYMYIPIMFFYGARRYHGYSKSVLLRRWSVADLCIWNAKKRTAGHMIFISDAASRNSITGIHRSTSRIIFC